MDSDTARFLVLATGYAAAGKTTLAPKLAAQLDALWISRDAIHEMVYSGWEPRHPALFQSTYDPQIGESTYFEGRVTWNLFLWMLKGTTSHVPVVADTPFNHDWNRTMFAEAAKDIGVPMIEVVLRGEPEALLGRARKRAVSGQVHEIKARFSVNSLPYYEREYQPVLPASQVINVDVTDLGAVDTAGIARSVRKRLSGGR